MELFKVTQHLRRVVNEEINVQEEMEDQAPPGFEKGNAHHGLDSLTSKSNPQGKLDCSQKKEKDSVSDSQNTVTKAPDCLSPPGSERVRDDNVEPPPGFEVFGNKSSKKNPRRQHQSMERRVTRSQKQVEKNSSQVTSESIIKLAKESIEIGNLLGLKVIDKEEAAIRRIINSLKEGKKKRSSLTQVPK